MCVKYFINSNLFFFFKEPTRLGECGCEVKKGVKDDSGFVPGDDVIDRKREAREAGFVEDKELYFWHVRLKDTAGPPATKHT